MICHLVELNSKLGSVYDLPTISIRMNSMLTATLTTEKGPFQFPWFSNLGRAPTFKGGMWHGAKPEEES